MFRKNKKIAVIVLCVVEALSMMNMPSFVYAQEVINEEEVAIVDYEEDVDVEVATDDDIEVVEDTVDISEEDEVVADLEDEDIAIGDSDSEEAEEVATEESEILAEDTTSVDAASITIENADGEEDPEDYSIELALYPKDSSKKDAGVYNYTAIKNALREVDPTEKNMLEVKIVAATDCGGKSKIIPIESDSGSIAIRSMTTLDLNGYTLLATGKKFLEANIFNNTDYDGKRSSKQGCTTGKGYKLSHDIIIKNGTIDGNVESVKSKVNMVTFGHMQNLQFIDVTFTHNAKNHLVELDGCKDVLFDGCTFDGYLYQGDKSDYVDGYISKEALEIDIAGKGKNWTGAYDGDDTVCENIRVINCDFLDYPTGIGDHHSLPGKNTTGVEISNCNFKYSGKDTSGCAVRTYAFDNCVVSNNLFDGKYSAPLRIYGGSNITVSGNKITKSEADGIYINASTVTGTKNKEAISGITISKNTVKANEKGIDIGGKTVVKSITDNKITIVGKNKKVSHIALFVFESKVVGDISGNTMTGKYLLSALYAKKSKLKNIYSNNITALDKGICFEDSSAGVVGGSKDKQNVILSTSKTASDTLRATGKSPIKEISYNTITSTYGNAVRIASGATVDKMNNNTISSKNGFALTVSGKGTVINTISKNKFISNKKMPTVALKVSEQALVKTISSNTFGTKKAPVCICIRVSGKGSKVNLIKGNTFNYSLYDIKTDNGGVVKKKIK